VGWAFSTDRAQKSMSADYVPRITGTIGRNLKKLLILPGKYRVSVPAFHCPSRLVSSITLGNAGETIDFPIRMLREKTTGRA
jgi:hypothetical protein